MKPTSPHSLLRTALVCQLLLSPALAQTQQSVSVTTLPVPPGGTAIAPNDGLDDGFTLWYNLLTNAQSNTRYEFPAGEYTIDASLGYLQGLGTGGLYTGTIPLANVTNVTLKGLGDGATLKWRGFDPAVYNGRGNNVYFPGGGAGTGGFIAVLNAGDITFSNLRIDMERSSSTWAVVTAVDAANGIVSAEITDSDCFLPIGSLPNPQFVIDLTSETAMRGVLNAQPQSIVAAAASSTQALSLTFPSWIVASNHLAVVAAGDRIVMAHQKYGGDAFAVVNCSGQVAFQDVSIRACAGMGIRTDRATDVLVERVSFEPSGMRLLSSTADGINLGHSSGDVLVKDSVVRRTGDDAFAFYQNIASVTATDAVASQLTVDQTGGQNRLPFLSWQAGDLVEIMSVDQSQVVASATVAATPAPGFPTTVSVNNTSANFWAVVQAQLVGMTAPCGPAIYNASQLPDSVVVERCGATDICGRGLIAMVPGILASNSVWARLLSSGVIGGAAMSYGQWTGPGADGLQVTNCAFVDVNRGTSVDAPGPENAAIILRSFYNTDEALGYSSTKVPAAVGATSGVTFSEIELVRTRMGGLNLSSVSSVLVDDCLFSNVSQGAMLPQSYSGTTATVEETSLIYATLVDTLAVTNNSGFAPYSSTVQIGPSVSGLTQSGNHW